MKTFSIALAAYLACCACATQVLTGEVSRGGHQVIQVTGAPTVASLDFDVQGVRVQLQRVRFQDAIYTEATAFRIPVREGLMDDEYEFGYIDLHIAKVALRLDADNHFTQLLPGDHLRGIKSMDSTLYAMDESLVARIKMPIILWN